MSVILSNLAKVLELAAVLEVFSHELMKEARLSEMLGRRFAFQ